MKNYYFSVFEAYDQQGKLLKKTVTVSISPNEKPGCTIDYSNLTTQQKEDVDNALATINELANN